MESLAEILDGIEWHEISKEWRDKETGEPIIWGGGLAPDPPEPEAPRLDLKRTQGSKDYLHELEVKKCGCGASWCPACWKKRGLKKALKRVRRMYWKRVRHIVLTVDRRLFYNAAEAFFTISNNKAIASLFRNLDRTIGKENVDWIWFLEWHEDGFPHWHVFFESTKKGRHGRIGFRNIKRYWSYGDVKEMYIADEKHWEKMFGYVEKTGYFDDEKKADYQGRLPEWALSYTGTIRRFSGKVRPDHMLDEQELQERNKKRREKRVNDVVVDCETGEVIRTIKETGERQERPYEVIIQGCGSQSMVSVYTPDAVGTEILNIPFSEWRKYGSRYDEDLKATVVFLTSWQLNKIRKEFDLSHSVLDLLDGKNWEDLQYGFG